MSHDRWRDELHQARQDTGRLVALLSRGAPTDGLQIAGTALLGAERHPGSSDLIADLAGSLQARGWLGDVELGAASSKIGEAAEL